AAGPGRYPTSQSGKFERLREVPQGKAGGFQLLFQVRTISPSLDAGRLRGRIDLQHPVEVLQIDRDRCRVVRAGRRLDSSDDAGASSEGHCRRSRGAAPVQYVGDLLFGARERDRIWRIREVAAEDSDAVGKRAAIAVRQPLVVISGADALERCRYADSRPVQRDVCSVRRRSGVETGDSQATGEDTV